MSLTSTAPRQSLAVANLICMASMIIWAAGLPSGDHLIPLMAADQLNTLRMVSGAGALLPLWIALEGWGALGRVNWLKGILNGSLIGLGAWLLVEGQARGGAVTVAVISALLPVVGIILEVLFDGRRLTLALVLGLILSVIGAFLAMDFERGGMTLGLGALLCFGSVVTFSIGSRFTVTAFPDQTPLGRTALSLTGAFLGALAVSLTKLALGAPPPDVSAWGGKELGAVFMYGVGSLAIAQYLFIICVERLGIGLSSIHINAAPFYVMLILFAFGQPWNWTQAGAAAVVGLGVLLAQGVIPLPFGRPR